MEIEINMEYNMEVDLGNEDVPKGIHELVGEQLEDACFREGLIGMSALILSQFHTHWKQMKR